MYFYYRQQIYFLQKNQLILLEQNAAPGHTSLDVLNIRVWTSKTSFSFVTFLKQRKNEIVKALVVSYFKVRGQCYTTYINVDVSFLI